MTMIYPMAAMVFYIFGIGIMTFMVRKKAVSSKAVNFKYFRVYDVTSGAPPEFLIRVGRHYDNQMQLPLLFLITCLACMFHGLNGWITVSLAWAFVVSRMLHSFILLGSNNVLYRAQAYALGWILIVVLWIIIVTQGLSAPVL